MAPRWQQRREERQRAREQNKATASTPTPPTARKPRRGSAPKGTQFTNGSGNAFESLKAKPIATPSRGGTAGRGVRKPVEQPAGQVDPKPMAESYYDQARKADPTGVPGQLPPSAAGSTTKTETNGNGVTQTFKNTGFTAAGFSEANDMLSNLGIQGVGYGKFQSNNLYTKPDTKIEGTDPSQKVDSLVDIPESGLNSNIATNFQSDIVKGAEFSATEAIVPEAAGSYGSQSSGASGEMGSQERYRSEMLNNGKTSQGGLRAAEASKGLLYASGKYWQANPNAGTEGQNDFLEISRDDAMAIKSSDQSAQSFLSSKIDAVKPSSKPDTEKKPKTDPLSK